MARGGSSQVGVAITTLQHSLFSQDILRSLLLDKTARLDFGSPFHVPTHQGSRVQKIWGQTEEGSQLKEHTARLSAPAHPHPTHRKPFSADCCFPRLFRNHLPLSPLCPLIVSSRHGVGKRTDRQVPVGSEREWGRREGRGESQPDVRQSCLSQSCLACFTHLSKFKLNEPKLYVINSSTPQSHSSHFKCSVPTGVEHCPHHRKSHWTAPPSRGLARTARRSYPALHFPSWTTLRSKPRLSWSVQMRSAAP